MTDIKLTYFDLKGRAEISRLILSYSGVRFTDERLTGAQFGAIKSSLAYGQMPILNYKGQVLYQSITIARFLAREFKLAGKSNIESAQADEVVDAVLDLQTGMFKEVGAGNTAGVEKVLDTTWPAGLANLEKVLTARGGQFFAGNNLTWADLAVYYFCVDGVGGKTPKDLRPFPKIANLVQRVGEIPNIKNWMAARPVNHM